MERVDRLKDMQKRKKLLVKLRQAVYVVIVAYVAVVLLYNFVFVSAESFTWILTGSSRTVYYNVTQSGDDAFLHLNHMSFSATATAQPFQMTGYDIEGGLVYSIPDRVYNATHREVPSNTWLEFWSDDPSMLPTGSITFYQINESTIGPFTSYADLNDAPYPWFIGNIPLSEFGRGSNPLGWEGWREGSLRFLTNAVNKIGSPYFPGLDNNSLGLKYLASSGYLEYFNTYDDNSSRAPRIGVVWEMQEWINVTAPGGVSGDDYMEDYRGFHLWNMTGYENLSTYTEVDPMSVISFDNDYLIDVAIGWDYWYNWGDGYQETYLLRTGTPIQNFTNYIEFRWYTKLTQEHVTSHRPDTSYLWVKNYLGQSERASHWIEPSVSAGSHRTAIVQDLVYYDYSVGYGTVGDQWWTAYRITPGENVTVSLWAGDPYSQPDWESAPDQLATELTGPDDGDVYSGNFTQELKVIASHTGASNYEGHSHFDFGYLTVQPDGEVEAVFFASDDNGTLLSDLYPDSIDPEYDDIEDLKDAIDRLLGGVGGDYDILPDLGNTLILLMGIMGMIMIPGSFIMLGHSIREGDWVTGFYYLLMFFFLGLGFVTVWLFG